MPFEVQTCPKCGAMITPNLARCRQCKTFLHGNRFEGALFERLLPEGLSQHPGTGLMVITLFAYYGLMIALAGVDSVLGLSPYAIRQLGGVTSLGVLQGEYWRFATGMMGHAGIVHLFFNLYVLTVVGPLVEEIFDRKKMMIIFIVGGVLAMVASFGVSTLVFGQINRTTIGASGGTCALLGACLIGARRRGAGAEHIVRTMTQWSAFMLLFGLAVPGVDNAAHIGGWLVGAGLAAAFPLGLNATFVLNQLYSAIIVTLLAGLAASAGFMVLDVQKYGATLEADAHGRRFLFFEYAEGKKPEYSSQMILAQKCRSQWQAWSDGRETSARTKAIDICERARRAWPAQPNSYRALAILYEDAEQPEQVQKNLLALEWLR
ncbi:MAG: rhomboid family intramembrane serine protease [Myxococcota bacterium]